MAVRIKTHWLRRLIPPPERVMLWMLLLSAGLITLMAYPDLVVNRQAYNQGDVAETDIKASRDFLVENAEATDAARRKAATSILTVYDHDDLLGDRNLKRVQDAFSGARKVIADREKQQEARETAAPDPAMVLDGPPAPQAKPANLSEVVWAYKKRFEEMLGVEVSEGAYKLLERERFSQAIADSITHIVGEILDNGVVANKELLLEEMDRGIILRGIESRNEHYATNLRHYYGPDQAKAMVRIIGDPLLASANYSVVNLIVDLAQRLVQPNITPNRLETTNRRKAAMETVKPVYYQVKAGEMVIREGERITDLHLAKLAAMHRNASQKEALFRGLGTGLLILFFLFTWHFVYFREKRAGSSFRLKDMGLLCLTLIAFFGLAKISVALSASLADSSGAYGAAPSAVFYGTPLAAGAMTLCLFLGLESALAFAVILTFSVTILFDNSFHAWTYFLVGSVLGAYWVRNCPERSVMIRAGIKVGLMNVGMVTAIFLQKGSAFGESFLWDATAAFLGGGVLSGVLTTGLVPLVEAALSYSTDIKLLELANLDRPVLRRLMIEAPGTYHHCVVVGSMVEAAAAEIGANPLLSKVCGYYHDIGKLHKPLYFIENQMGGKNRHDKLAPSMSALILIAHVREGGEMARKYHLGPAIADAILQHHGTSLIRPFYEKARQIRGDENVKEGDFRYPGPKPQTKEAGLVMLADVVEAASRTLDNPTPARIQGHVQRLIRAIFTDGQLDECELTLKNLHQIAKSFNKILAGIHHHRVEYPDQQPAKTNGKTNGKKAALASLDQQPAEPVSDSEKEPEPDGGTHLRRLGIS
ncbi:MAG: HDIG domain-containing protein [Proteobacteria bacterium]|nr:HDIG domain-containing protein [Pseudomonadota bacterium]